MISTTDDARNRTRLLVFGAILVGVFAVILTVFLFVTRVGQILGS